MNRRGFAIGIVFLLLMVSSFVGVSNQTKQESVINMSVLSNLTSTNNGLMDSAWPMYKHDVRHTGLSPFNTSHNPGGIRWKYDALEPIHSSAAIDKKGVLYFGAEDFHNSLFTVHLNGSEKWCFDAGEFVYSSPALAKDGTVYIGSQGTNGKIFAINPNGTLKWCFEPHDFFSASPAIDLDGTIYLGSDNGNLYALYPNGTLKWTFSSGTNTALRSPAIGDNGIIYVTSFDSKLYTLDRNGSLQWIFDTPERFYSVAVIGDDGTIYLTPSCGLLYAINPDGSEKWKANTTSDELLTPALGPDGTIYVQGWCQYLDAFTPDGEKKWTIPVTDKHTEEIYSTPSVGNDGIIYVGVDEYLLAINPDGTIRWRTRLTSDHQPYDFCDVDPSPTIGEDGTIYIGSLFQGSSYWGYLYAIGGTKIQVPEEGHLYILGRDVRPTPFGLTIIIGRLPIQVAAFQEQNVKYVEFIVDNRTRYIDSSPPFSWTLKGLLFGKHTLSIKGYYMDGAISEEDMDILAFIM